MTLVMLVQSCFLNFDVFEQGTGIKQRGELTRYQAVKELCYSHGG